MIPEITLTRLAGFKRGESLRFSSSPVSLGTAATSQMAFDPTWDRTVSATHAVLEWRGDSWWIRDQSKDGVWSKGRRCAGEEKIAPGSELELGRGGPRLKFDYVPAVAGAGSPRSSASPAETRSVPVALSPSGNPGTPPVLAAPVSPVTGRTGRGLPVGLIAAVAAVIAIAAGVWWFQSKRPAGGAAAEAGRSPANPGQTPAGPSNSSLVWEPFLEMGGQVYPSYLIASATVKMESADSDLSPNRLGDPLGVVGVKITSPENNAKVRVGFLANSILQNSSIEVTLPEKGETYTIYPKINYDFEALLKIKQAIPITLVAEVSVHDRPGERKSVIARLSPINDCPFYIRDKTAKFGHRDLSWMFAAYVNENHPWGDDVRKAALKTGIVDHFAGYQGKPQEVMVEVFAIWHVFQRLGFKYSNVTTTSSGSDVVYSQQVRFVDQSIQGAQANCVDGTVLFASVLRQIGIEPILVMVPGHMFLGFLAAPGNPDSLYFLETTMIGSADLSNIAALKGAPAEIFNGIKAVAASNKTGQDKIKESIETFKAALAKGQQQAQENAEKFSQPGSGAKLISVLGARKMGVTPLAYQP